MRLSEQNMKLAFYLARRFLRKNRLPQAELEDLEGEALVALVRAEGKFNTSRGVTFGSYAGRAMWNALVSYRLSGRRAITRCHQDEGRQVERACPLPAPEQQAAARDLLRVARSRLGAEHLLALEGHLEGRTNREVGENEGYCKEWSRRRARQALEELRGLK